MQGIFIWPVGIILAWLSPAWRRIDKVVTTLIPLFCISFILVGTFVASYSYHQEPEIEYREIENSPYAAGPDIDPTVPLNLLLLTAATLYCIAWNGFYRLHDCGWG